MKLEIRLGFSIYGLNLNYIRYCVGGRHRQKTTVTPRQWCKGKQKERVITCKKRDCMIVSKRDRSQCDLQIGDAKMKRCWSLPIWLVSHPFTIEIAKCNHKNYSGFSVFSHAIGTFKTLEEGLRMLRLKPYTNKGTTDKRICSQQINTMNIFKK